MCLDWFQLVYKGFSRSEWGLVCLDMFSCVLMGFSGFGQLSVGLDWTGFSGSFKVSAGLERFKLVLTCLSRS